MTATSRSPAATGTEFAAIGPLVCAFGAVVLWSSGFVGISYALKSIEPGPLVLLRFLCASTFFLLLFALGKVRRPARSDLPGLILLGLVGHALYHMCGSFAQTRVTAGTAGVMMGLIPVVSALLAIPLLGERPSLRAWIGIALGFVGVVLVCFGATGRIDFEPMALLALFAACCSSVLFVYQKRWLDRYTGLDLAAYGIWTCAAAMLVFAPQVPQALAHATPGALLVIAYLGIVPTAGGYMLWNFALSRQPVGRVSSLLNIEPVIVFLLAWLLIGEVPTGLSLIGAGFALLGVYVVTRASKPLP